MTGTDFYYDSHALSDFGLIMLGTDEDQDFVPRSVIATEQSAKRPEQYVFNTSYDDTLVLNFFIFKNPCLYSEQTEMCFTQNNLRDIRSWLESPKTPKELVVENKKKKDDEIICYFGIFTEVQPYIIGADCYGLHLTFQCNAPYGYSVPMTQVYNLSKYANTVKYKYACSNDEKYDYIYPTIKIYLNSSISNKGTLTIKNISDNNNSLSLKIPNTTTLTIDCKKKQILNANNTLLRLCDLGLNADEILDYTSLFSGSLSVYWPRLVYGENEFEFTTSVLGSVTKIEVTARFIRKVDGF